MKQSPCSASKIGVFPWFVPSNVRYCLAHASQSSYELNSLLSAEATNSCRTRCSPTVLKKPGQRLSLPGFLQAESISNPFAVQKSSINFWRSLYRFFEPPASTRTSVWIDLFPLYVIITYGSFRNFTIAYCSSRDMVSDSTKQYLYSLIYSSRQRFSRFTISALNGLILKVTPDSNPSPSWYTFRNLIISSLLNKVHSSLLRSPVSLIFRNFPKAKASFARGPYAMFSTSAILLRSTLPVREIFCVSGTPGTLL